MLKPRIKESTGTYVGLKHAFYANTGSLQCQTTDQEDEQHKIWEK
jgi:hypothetical protein